MIKVLDAKIVDNFYTKLRPSTQTQNLYSTKEIEYSKIKLLTLEMRKVNTNTVNSFILKFNGQITAINYLKN